MSPKTKQALIVAVVAMGGAGLLAIVMLLEWLPGFPAGSVQPDAPAVRVAPGPAPAESLLPGETIVSAEDIAKPAIMPSPQPPVAQAAKPAPATPDAKAASQNFPPQRLFSRGRCINCGTVSATATVENRRNNRITWEVRVRFENGMRRVFRFPTDPGYQEGDQVLFSHGRLTRD